MTEKELRAFIEKTEGELLKHLGDEIKKFFDKELTAEVQEKEGLYSKRTFPNPRASIKPLAQVNMVSNITFHLLAQQLVLLFAERPTIDREKVFKTTMENVRELTNEYVELLKETHGKADDKGLSS